MVTYGQIPLPFRSAQFNGGIIPTIYEKNKNPVLFNELIVRDIEVHDGGDPLPGGGSSSIGRGYQRKLVDRTMTPYTTKGVTNLYCSLKEKDRIASCIYAHINHSDPTHVYVYIDLIWSNREYLKSQKELPLTSGTDILQLFEGFVKNYLQINEIVLASVITEETRIIKISDISYKFSFKSPFTLYCANGYRIMNIDNVMVTHIEGPPTFFVTFQVIDPSKNWGIVLPRNEHEPYLFLYNGEDSPELKMVKYL